MIVSLEIRQAVVLGSGMLAIRVAMSLRTLFLFNLPG